MHLRGLFGAGLGVGVGVGGEVREILTVITNIIKTLQKKTLLENFNLGMLCTASHIA